MIRVLVVDDHPLFRDGLQGLLATVDDVDVAARPVGVPVDQPRIAVRAEGRFDRARVDVHDRRGLDSLFARAHPSQPAADRAPGESTAPLS